MCLANASVAELASVLFCANMHCGQHIINSRHIISTDLHILKPYNLITIAFTMRRYGFFIKTIATTLQIKYKKIKMHKRVCLFSRFAVPSHAIYVHKNGSS